MPVGFDYLNPFDKVKDVLNDTRKAATKTAKVAKPTSARFGLDTAKKAASSFKTSPINQAPFRTTARAAGRAVRGGAPHLVAGNLTASAVLNNDALQEAAGVNQSDIDSVYQGVGNLQRQRGRDIAEFFGIDRNSGLADYFAAGSEFITPDALELVGRGALDERFGTNLAGGLQEATVAEGELNVNKLIQLGYEPNDATKIVLGYGDISLAEALSSQDNTKGSAPVSEATGYFTSPATAASRTGAAPDITADDIFRQITGELQPGQRRLTINTPEDGFDVGTLAVRTTGGGTGAIQSEDIAGLERAAAGSGQVNTGYNLTPAQRRQGVINYLTSGNLSSAAALASSPDELASLVGIVNQQQELARERNLTRQANARISLDQGFGDFFNAAAQRNFARSELQNIRARRSAQQNFANERELAQIAAGGKIGAAEISARSKAPTNIAKALTAYSEGINANLYKDLDPATFVEAVLTGNTSLLEPYVDPARIKQIADLNGITPEQAKRYILQKAGE